MDTLVYTVESNSSDNMFVPFENTNPINLTHLSCVFMSTY